MPPAPITFSEVAPHPPPPHGCITHSVVHYCLPHSGPGTCPVANGRELRAGEPVVLRTGASCDQWGLERVVGRRERCCVHTCSLCPPTPGLGTALHRLQMSPSLPWMPRPWTCPSKPGGEGNDLPTVVDHTHTEARGRLIPDRRPLPVAPPWVFTLESSGICICK